MGKSRETTIFMHMASHLHACWDTIYLGTPYPTRNLSLPKDLLWTMKAEPSTTVIVEMSYLIAFFITCNHAHRFNERMARIVNPGLDALIQGVAIGSHLVPQPAVNGRGEALGHAVVMFAEIRIVRAGERKSPKQLMWHLWRLILAALWMWLWDTEYTAWFKSIISSPFICCIEF